MKIGHAARANALAPIARTAKAAVLCNRTRSIYDRTAWDLTGQANEAPNRQYEIDINLRPFLGGQIGGNEGSKARLHVGTKNANQSRPRRLACDGVRARFSLDSKVKKAPPLP